MAIGSLKCYPVLVWQGLCSLLLCNGHKIYHCVWKINDNKFSCIIFWQSGSDVQVGQPFSGFPKKPPLLLFQSFSFTWWNNHNEMKTFCSSQATKRADILMVTLLFSSLYLSIAEYCLLRLCAVPVCHWSLTSPFTSSSKTLSTPPSNEARKLVGTYLYCCVL